MTVSVLDRRKRRAMSTRSALSKRRNGRARLSVFRSGKHIYAQIIDDVNAVTLCSASSVDKELKGKLANGGNKAAATEVGKLLAARASEKGVTEVVFDRGSYLYHGRVQALADAAREGGLQF